jgi:hypothetical protein
VAFGGQYPTKGRRNCPYGESHIPNEKPRRFGGRTIFAEANAPSPTEVTLNRIYPSVLGVAF